MRKIAFAVLVTFLGTANAQHKASNNYGLYAPARTPRVVVHGLSPVVAAGLNTPAMHKRLAAQGAEPVPPQLPEAFKATIAREYLVIEKQVRGLRIKDL